MMSVRTGLVALVLLVAAPASVAAQTLVPPAGRQGYYLGLGLRQGFLNAIADEDDPGFMQGGALTLRLGQMAGPLWGFGLVVTGGGGANDDWGGGYGALQLEVQANPMDNLAFRAGIGVGGLGVSRRKEDQKRESDPEGGAGTLYTAGMSYDWFPWWERGDSSGGFAFTVFLEATAMPTSELFVAGILSGIEITWWTGLEDNKLELAPEDAFKK